MGLISWLDIDPQHHFSIHNIPFGIISLSQADTPRPAIAIGDYVLDLKTFTACNGFASLSAIQPHQQVFSQPTLNAFAALGRPVHRFVRDFVQSIFLKDGPFPEVLERNEDLRKQALIPASTCQMHLPMQIGDYTDFYAGLNHAYNVGVLFRGVQNALQPNYRHLPVGYHGRASSIVVSGTPIRRPNGQILLDPKADVKQPVLQPSRKLDIELELGCLTCKSTKLGDPVSIRNAPDHLFGVVLLNDWSARDIQAWEYVPLGPFNSKNFATTISPWVVLMDALEPFATHGLVNNIKPLKYLDEAGRKSHYSIDLTYSVKTKSDVSSTLATVKAENLLYSFPQMLAHHTIGGCNINVGDLLGSGTISGEKSGEEGSLLEQSRNGQETITLSGGETRSFLQDGDTVVMSGVCRGEEGAFVGFGVCSGEILPAIDLDTLLV